MKRRDLGIFQTGTSSHSNFSLHLSSSMPSQQMRVKVLYGSNLMVHYEEDISASPTWYCEITCGDGSARTKATAASERPTWNETLNMNGKNDTLRFTLYSVVESSNDQVIGRSELRLSQLGQKQHTLSLKPVSGDGEAIGELTVEVTTTSSDTTTPNFIIVSVLEAKGVLAKDGKGPKATSDPFVELRSDRHAPQQTKVEQKTLRPRWRQRFFFRYVGNGQRLTLLVQDSDFWSNDFLGCCTINLDDWCSRFGTVKKVFWLALEPLENKGTASDLSPDRAMSYSRGRICLALEMVHVSRKAPNIDQGEMDHSTVVPKSRGLRGPDEVPGDDDEYESNLPPGSAIEYEGDADIEEQTDSAQETQAEREKQQAEHQKMLDEMSKIQFKPGDYQVRVRIVELRDLKPMDWNGTCDPVIAVDCMGQRQHTKVKLNQLSCVFDEYLFFNFHSLSADAVEGGNIKISVMDADGPSLFASNGVTSLDDLIGFFVIDIPYVYYQRNHELHQKWVALVGNDKRTSDRIQGYLLLSIVVLGPGDKLVMHKESEDKDALNDCSDPSEQPDMDSLVIVPPRVVQTLKYLVVTVHRAEHLPSMDNNILKSGGIDAYVQVYFAGQSALKTKVKTSHDASRSVKFSEELWFPVLLPTMSNRVLVSVWDSDVGSDDELVAKLMETLYFSSVQANPTYHTHRWYNLYGPPVGYVIGSKARELMQDSPKTASTYRGRVLLSLRVEDDSTSLNDRPHTRNLINDELLPASAQYILRISLLYATDIPTSVGNDACFSIAIGYEEVWTSEVKVEDGVCHLNQYISIPELELPTDLDQAPDVFVYLVKSKSERICYARIQAKTLWREQPTSPTSCDIVHPTWISLHEDRVLDELKDSDYTGNVLMSLHLERGIGDEHLERRIGSQWRAHAAQAVAHTQYIVIAYVYQGRSLPSADSDGLLDPYVKVICAGEEKRTSIQQNTCDPCFYEAMMVEIEVPSDSNLLPKLSLHVYDYDKYSSRDEYVGRTSFSLRDMNVISSKEYAAAVEAGKHSGPRPQWHPIKYMDDGDTYGELLLSFELIKKDTPDARIPSPESIKPKAKKKFVEITCLGCRNLQPVGFTPVSTPYIEFRMDQGSASRLTNRVSKPTPQNPNFLQRMLLPVDIPSDPLFAPRLRVSVYDRLLGGFYTPLLGVCSIDLCSTMPMWNNQPNPLYKQPQTGVSIGNPFMEQKSDLSTFPGSTSHLEQNLSPSQPSSPLNKRREEANKLKSTLADDKEDDSSDETPAYLVNRRVLDGRLEEELQPPFETYSLFRGSMLKAKQGDETDYRSVGYFKGIIRVVDSDDEEPLIDLNAFIQPQEYIIRVYVLDALHVIPQNHHQSCDPYLRLTVGNGNRQSQVINDRSKYQKKTLHPRIHNMYEFKTKLPGSSELKIDLLDYDPFAIPGLPEGFTSGLFSVGSSSHGDTLIGTTLIDLEDRLFSPSGQHDRNVSALKDHVNPLEFRPMYVPQYTHSQADIRMWVDILTIEQSQVSPPIDISLPPPEEYEVRVIMYKAKDVVPGDYSGLSDLYLTAWFQARDNEKQSTDTHWRAKRGKASFNWRMKFPVTLPIDPEDATQRGELHVQMWDKDIKYDDCLAETTINIGHFLERAHKTKEVINVYAKERSPNEDSSSFDKSSGQASSKTTGQPRGATRPSVSSSATDIAIDIGKYDEGEGESTRLLEQDSGPTSYTSQRTKQGAPQEEDEVTMEEAKSLVTSFKRRIGLDGEDPDDSHWQTFYTHDKDTNDRVEAGQVLLSIEILPRSLAQTYAAGFGRSEPNNFPYLAEPTDRLHLSAMWNPLYVMEAFMGPRYYRIFSSIILTAATILLFIYIGPFINTCILVSEMIPSPYGWVVLGTGIGLLLLGTLHISRRCHRAVRSTDAKDK